MFRHALLILALSIALGPATLPGSAQAETWTAKVIGVADGDTITVLHDRKPRKIRLHGVDCPEKAQAFGQQAKQLTAKLVFDKRVRVKVETTDRYGRTVAEVFFGDRSLGEELVQAGLAWWYKRYAPRAKVLEVLEEQARQAKRGLWADPSPTPPWKFRRRGKPFKGNVKSHVFHGPRCRHYSCKSCTARFETAEAALKAGYRPHRACVSTAKRSSRGSPARLKSYWKVELDKLYFLDVIFRRGEWIPEKTLPMPYHHATRIVWTNIDKFSRALADSKGSRRFTFRVTRRDVRKVPGQRQWLTTYHATLLRVN